MFLDTAHDIPGTNIRMADNHTAAKILKKAYEKAYPKDKVLFDPECSHCYVYAKNKETAKRFLLWMYENYIKDWLKKNDVEHYAQFELDYKNSEKELQQYFVHLMTKF